MRERLGFGYEKRTDNTPSKFTARAMFLKAIYQLRPDVINDLFEVGCPAFERLILNVNNRPKIEEMAQTATEYVIESYLTPREFESIAVRGIIKDKQVWTKLDGSKETDSILQDWGERWNLTGEWCLECARIALCNFVYDRRVRSLSYEQMKRSAWLWTVKNLRTTGIVKGSSQEYEAQQSHPFLESEFNFEYREFVFNFPNCFSGIKSIEEWEEQVFETFEKKVTDYKFDKAKEQFQMQAAFLKAVDSHIKEVRTKAKKLGYKISSTKEQKHFEWLVRYQIPPIESYADIALTEYNNLNLWTAIYKGVKDTAKLIGFERRRTKSKKKLSHNTPKRRVTSSHKKTN